MNATLLFGPLDGEVIGLESHKAVPTIRAISESGSETLYHYSYTVDNELVYVWAQINQGALGRIGKR